MTADPRLRALLWSLVPLAAFFVGAAVGEPMADHPVHIEWSGAVASLPAYLLMVALPAALPLVVARHRATKMAVLTAVTTVAAVAGWLVVTTDDAQAGLAVFLVPYVAVPLALALRLGQLAVRGLGLVRGGGLRRGEP